MPPVVPTATYRLQLSGQFGFEQAAELVPYLRALGISHMYASPFLKARSGSAHGYDIVDHGQLNPEFGGERGFDKLSDALAAADMGLILDFVPNHMGIGCADNAWWLDVLEWGPKSPHAASFDIDWATLPYRPQGGLLLPILGKPYGEALEAGEIALKYDRGEGSFSAWYFTHRLPIRPDRYSEILKSVVAAAGAADEAAGQRLIELSNWFPALGEPVREDTPKLKAALAALEGGADVIERGLHAYAPQANDPVRVTVLHRLLERQHYRVAYWRVAFTEINYRRFFDINDLAGIRIENLRTFAAVHKLVASLIARGRLHGLRLDHVDGLSDPTQYCRRLLRLVRAARGSGGRRFYVVAEKILADKESMPRLPGVEGTTGYDVLNVISRLLLDGAGLPNLDAFHHEMTGEAADFEDIVHRAKVRVLETMLASEFTVLCRLLARIAAGHWPSRDYTFERLRAALQLYFVHFPVYRTYISGGSISADDRAIITRTVERARAQWYGPDPDIFDFLQDVLILDLVAPGRSGYSSARVRRFSGKVQQLTGPLMAKALEDTAFYRYFRLLALNEVGGDPSLPAISASEFHSRMRARTAQAHALTATATHDTKRGEDARTRILALSELAEDWSAAVRTWKSLNEPLVDDSRGRAPSRGHEYMLYQALIGAWPGTDFGPEFVERMQAYAIKAMREGKRESSWYNPNEAYEAAVVRFLQGVLDRRRSGAFLDSFASFAARTSLLGTLNSLSQLVLKATIPGVPDFYQGTELWDLSLVDPDNRRPVDFDSRKQVVVALATDPDWTRLVSTWEDGLIKLALTRRLLSLRTEFRDLFTNGGYEPIEVSGPHRQHVLAFARSLRREAVIVAVGRHFAPLTSGGRHWPHGEQWLAALKLDQFDIAANRLGPAAPSSRGDVPLSALFSAIPIAVLRALRRKNGTEHPKSRLFMEV